MDKNIGLMRLARSKKVTAADILQCLSDQRTLDIFRIIATKNKINSKTLRSMNDISRKQYYSRVHRLLKLGLIMRKSAVFSLTTFRKVVYGSSSKLDAAIKEYWSLKAVDNLQGSEELNTKTLRKLINEVVNTDSIKKILLDCH